MINTDDLCHKSCEPIDPKRVTAFIDLGFDPLDPTKIVLSSSWGTTALDLGDLVKNGETQTTMKLSPVNNPQYLEYDGEDGVPQCIDGDDLARIIPVTKLDGIDQTTPLADGDTYVYDAELGMLVPYNVGGGISNLETRVATLESTVTAQAATIAALTGSLNAIQNMLSRPANIPANARIVWGNIDVYSDNTNTGLKTSGLYTHDPSTDATNDLEFA